MARPGKQGIDYFSLDTHMEDKVKLVEAKYGMEGYGILIKLWQKIYRHGYYIKWKDEIQLLFSNEVNVDKNRVNDVINSCLEWGVFNKNLFQKYNILTSHGIQCRFLKATARRKEVEIIKEFSLLKEKELNDNVIFVDLNGNEENEDNNPDSQQVNVNNNPNPPEDNEHISEQSKVKENTHNGARARVRKLHQETFGCNLTPTNFSKLKNLIDEGLNWKVIQQAYEMAQGYDPDSFRYVEKILINWLNEGITSVEEVKSKEERFENKNSSPPGVVELSEEEKAEAERVAGYRD